MERSLGQPDARPVLDRDLLVDWLCLGRSARSKRTLPPHDDIDMQMLDRARLHLIAKAAQMGDTLDQWLEAGG